jgi:hypothetical protein
MADDDSAETTLAGRLGGPLRPAVVARLGVLTCHALARGGRPRGDLCPSAILLVTSAQGDVTVTMRSPDRRAPMYLSPEQVTHATPPDARSDVYSLSMILYEALAGVLPFPACATVEQLLTVLITQDPRDIGEAAPWLDPKLARVVERGLHREPSRRWPSPEALGEALAEFTGGSERLTPRTRWALPEEDRLPHALRRGSTVGIATLTWAIVTLVAGAAVVTASALWFSGRTRGASADRRDAGAPVESPVPARSRAAKREVARALLEKESFFIHLDPRRAGVQVPAQFRAQPQLVLQVGRDLAIPIPDLDLGAAGITATLSFEHRPFTCTIPWAAVYALVGEDGTGGVWEEDAPPEVAAERPRKEGSPDAGGM